MAQWYEKLGAKIGLRVAGLGLLVSAWLECDWLRRLVMENPAADMTGAEFLLGALMFLSASAGAMLLIMGGGLWRPVKVSDRWADSSVAPVPRDFEESLHLLGDAERGDNPGGKGTADPRGAEKS